MPVFDDAEFFRPVFALVGAAVLALGFGLAAILAERVAGGAWAVTPAAQVLAAAAFVGYLAVAALRARVPPS